MEIRVSLSDLKRHTSCIDEEIRIARRIEDMAANAFLLSPREDEILRSVRRLNESIRTRREIMETMDQSLQDQENWLREYVDSLQRAQRR